MSLTSNSSKYYRLGCSKTNLFYVWCPQFEIRRSLYVVSSAWNQEKLIYRSSTRKLHKVNLMFVCVIFLQGNELFREVHPWLSAVLHTILGHNQDLDFNSPIPGLQSFYDLWVLALLMEFVVYNRVKDK